MEKIEIFVLENDFLKVELLNLGAVIKKIELKDKNGILRNVILGFEDIEKYIKTLGLYKAKSKNIVGMANMLRDVYDYEIPKTREELEKLPGVGRKTANVVLAVGFNIPAIAVDTHVERVAKMFGLAEKNDSPLQVEKELMSIFPMESWGKIHHQLIHLGRYKLPARGERTIDPELEKLLLKN